MQDRARGNVVNALGNLLHVEFEGAIRQGEIASIHLGATPLKGEVIEIQGNRAKIQVFEETWGIHLGTPVTFEGHLLEAELGPGLLGLIADGLQNPLEKLADHCGLFLARGVYLPPLDRGRKWDFHPVIQEGAVVRRGDELGYVMEGRFHHKIMVPFTASGEYAITWVAKGGAYTIDSVVARGVDRAGHEGAWTMVQKWPVKHPLLLGEKVKPDRMMSTGERIIDTQFPLLKGGSFASPGPFGAGKTVLQHHLAKYSDVDLVVIVACGERAGEVVEVLRTFPHLIDPHTHDPLMERTVIICNTSSMPVAAREASIYMGATIAEYYRQMGLDVLLLADSTSRWAQAMREMSGRLEEIPGEEAFPAYLASRISAFYERSGVIELPGGARGSLTIGGTVSPAGGSFEEPVTQATLACVGAFLGLSKERADRRRFPAMDPLTSYSTYVDAVARLLEAQVPGWGAQVKRLGLLLHEADEIRRRMEVIGEEGVTLEDMVTYLKAELYDFAYLQQNAFDTEDAYSPLKRQIPLFGLVQTIMDAPFSFTDQAHARTFFLDLQNSLKNLNFMPFESDRYHTGYQRIEEKIAQAVKGVS